MSKESFVVEEKIHHKTNAIANLVRLFCMLPLWRNVFPLWLFVSVTAAALPSFFRWYMAKFDDCEAARCEVVLKNFFQIPIPISLEVFCAITILAAFLRVASWIIFDVSGQISSINLHTKMVHSLLATRTTYFDQNPSGRLLNRILGDFEHIRYEVITLSGDTFNATLELLLGALLLCFISPALLLLIVVLLVAFFYFQHYSSKILQLVKQDFSIARSKLFSRQNDLIDGAEVFSLYKKLNILMDRIVREMKTFAKAEMLLGKIDAWSNLWSNIVGEIYCFVVILILMFAVSKNIVDIAIAGTIISALFGLTSGLWWLNWSAISLSGSLVFAERVFEITDLPSEKEEETTRVITHCLSKPPQETHLHLNHPCEIEFINYSMSYRKDTPIIIDNFSRVIPAGKKVAVKGRTGSGKSSLLQALLRMVHVRQGDILMNKASIYQFPLEEYRAHFGVIPQFPWLFMGTLRENLDRSGRVPDEILLHYLSLAGINLSLDYFLREGGLNLSPGERQLVAIVRVLAANKKYLLLDEPTSFIDPITDVKATKLLDTHSAGKTLLVIAHREETISNAEVIITM